MSEKIELKAGPPLGLIPLLFVGCFTIPFFLVWYGVLIGFTVSVDAMGAKLFSALFYIAPLAILFPMFRRLKKGLGGGGDRVVFDTGLRQVLVGDQARYAFDRVQKIKMVTGRPAESRIPMCRFIIDIHGANSVVGPWQLPTESTRALGKRLSDVTDAPFET